MLKRTFDVAASTTILLLLSPIVAAVACLTWLTDGRSPFYLAPRVGIRGEKFQMIKLRSMVIDADLSGVDSTSVNDPRVTRLGRVIRKCKFDEITQLWNVIRGDMSLVGPRPNVPREVALYTPLERRLLELKPGVTDFASIAFSDLGEILGNHPDPNSAYRQLVRPSKSRLGLFYVDHQTFCVDVQICGLTALALFSRRLALRLMGVLLRRLGAEDTLIRTATRTAPLGPSLPPDFENEVNTETVR